METQTFNVKARRQMKLSEAVTKLKFFEGYRFRVAFDLEGVPEILVDEPKPTGEGLGPGPSRLLSAAVGHCLSSSLLYCLRKAKIEVKNLETTVKLSTVRNEEGRLRVRDIDVQIELDVREEDKQRIPRYLKVFENYCTVTQSVREGVYVKVRIV
jgi:uncharacterized OsmC-like protein